jgi:Cell wall hydrolyses involved in spore germination
MAYSERELFARLINCEAGGEGLDGMKAVATVIMNRVRVSGGEYQRVCQGSLRKVIFQPTQFTCAMETVYGQYNPQNLYNTDPEQQHYDVADWALAGNVHWGAGESLWYFNPFAPSCIGGFPANGSGTFFDRVNQHCFYIPTAKYWQT